MNTVLAAGSVLGLSQTVFWLAAFVIFLVVEAVVPGLISIWFAIGALAALLSAFFHAPFWLQVIWFLVVSIAALAATRPLAKKYINARAMPTNADRILGKDCVVRERIDNLNGTGAVSADGNVWTARMEREDETAEAGEIVVVRRIEGVKLIVSKKPEA